MKKKLVWDKTGERLYETGVSQGVLYPIQTGGVYNSGTAWNGLSTVTESPSGAEPTAIYADNIKYLNLMSAEEFGGTIEAYMAPDEFAECDGSKEIAPGVFAGQQNRKMFGLSYKTLLGNDVDSNDYGYKLHLVYGCLASPSEKGYSTVNDSPEAITLSWEFSTTPVEIATLIDGKKLKPTSILTFDSTKVDAKKLAALEEILYGKDPSSAEADDGVEPRLIKFFKEFILKAYGEKSADGTYFEKSEEISRKFACTQFYNLLFMELATDDSKAAEFVNHVIPKVVDIKKHSENPEIAPVVATMN